MSPPAHMVGNFAPVPTEATVTELPVTGAIPPELAGQYLRNGPNPRSDVPGHWFLGDGMVHGVRLEAGRAVWYRNRWVRTRAFTEGTERAAGTERPSDPLAATANTHVVRHAGRLLVLVESAQPYEITCDLDTVGPYDFGGRLRTPMTAHPKICPTTGELHFFGYGGVEPPFLTYHRAAADGRLILSRPVDVPAHTMMHDFSLTAGHVIFMDLPVVFDLTAVLSGGMPYRWSDTYQARLGVLRRDDPHGDVRWYHITPGFVFHTVNAHDDGDRVVVHVIRQAEAFRPDTPVAAPSLWRWTIDPTTGSVDEEQLDDRPTEFPRIDDRRTGLPTSHGYTVASAIPGRITEGPAVTRYDLRTGVPTVHQFPASQVPGEATFVPADDRPDGPGWLMTFVYDATRDASDLTILDAGDLGAKPVARIHLPQRVPFGFHGNWIPDTDGSDR